MNFYLLGCLIAGGFLSLLALILVLNIFGLPANWLILGLVVIWKLVHPAAASLGILFWIIMIGIALLGEVLEFWTQMAKAKSHGSSSSGTFAGMVGAFAGAILFAPLFWGLGALLGALIGAWGGALVMELAKGRSGDEALHSAFGSMMGKFLGTVFKLGAGAMMIAVTAHHIWPARQEPPSIPVEAVMRKEKLIQSTTPSNSIFLGSSDERLVVFYLPA